MWGNIFLCHFNVPFHSVWRRCLSLTTLISALILVEGDISLSSYLPFYPSLVWWHCCLFVNLISLRKYCNMVCQHFVILSVTIRREWAQKTISSQGQFKSQKIIWSGIHFDITTLIHHSAVMILKLHFPISRAQTHTIIQTGDYQYKFIKMSHKGKNNGMLVLYLKRHTGNRQANGHRNNIKLIVHAYNSLTVFWTWTFKNVFIIRQDNT